MEFSYGKDGSALIARGITPEAWDALKSSYQIGDFTMPCCSTPAIPKTSSNGHHFFAHYTDECVTAPESIWHLNAKQLVASSLRHTGIEYQAEKDGKPFGWNWIADIFFSFEGRQIVIELQHSYQSLADYRRRQQRYRDCGVECYWLLYGPRYITVIKSMIKWRIKHEFGGKLPNTGTGPCSRDIPLALLGTGLPGMPDRGWPMMVWGACSLRLTLNEWMAGILERRFHWKDGAWIVTAR